MTDFEILKLKVMALVGAELADPYILRNKKIVSAKYDEKDNKFRLKLSSGDGIALSRELASDLIKTGKCNIYNGANYCRIKHFDVIEKALDIVDISNDAGQNEDLENFINNKTELASNIDVWKERWWEMFHDALSIQNLSFKESVEYANNAITSAIEGINKFFNGLEVKK